MPTKLTRRSFLGSAATAVAAAQTIIHRAHSADVIPGFDQTKTDYDRTKEWKPFSDRKIRVGLVGYGVCKFSAAFEFQNHPNVEVVFPIVARRWPNASSAPRPIHRSRRW